MKAKNAKPGVLVQYKYHHTHEEPGTIIEVAKSNKQPLGGHTPNDSGNHYPVHVSWPDCESGCWYRYDELRRIQ